MVENEEILVECIVIEDIIAISLTKRLKRIVFIKHVENMGVVQSFDVRGWWKLLFSL